MRRVTRQGTRTTLRRGLWIGIAATVGACASGGLSTTREPLRGVPGFDTRDYPGDRVMQRWFGASPYRWVGYYLPAPCYTGTTWAGRRQALHDIGWGFAVLYVGEQDWRAMGVAPADTVVENPRCSSAHLTPENGRAHADDAAAAAAADAFPAGTVIFLDVERVQSVSAELDSYVRAWVARMLETSRFVPGLYVHDVNVEAVYAAVADEYVRAARDDRPPLWVARTRDFEIAASPRESGYAAATIWQGVLNTREEWNGSRLNIDVNVSSSADPSRGR